MLFSFHELATWLTHFISNRTLLNTYYEKWAFVIVNANNDLFENIINQFEKLSPLSFRLKYKILSNSNALLTNHCSSSSTFIKKFNVKTWLHDRKNQIKMLPQESQDLSTKLS